MRDIPKMAWFRQNSASPFHLACFKMPGFIHLVARHIYVGWHKRSRRNPSVDLYLGNIVQECRKFGAPPLAKVKRIGANTYAYKDYIVVCRQDRPELIERLTRRSSTKLIYIIDDDLWAAETDATLPDDYRQRLLQFKAGQHDLLVSRADGIVVSSPLLRERYSQFGKPIGVLAPYWSDTLADCAHFAPLRNGALLEIAYLGSTSHRADRLFAVSIMEQILKVCPNTRFSIISGTDLPDWVKHHDRVRLLPPLPWTLYRRRLKSTRFHIAIYPMLDTPYNAARSLNKFYEHQITGAFGLYSRNWRYSDFIMQNEFGKALENKKEIWVEEIRNLAATPERLAQEQERILKTSNIKGVGEQQKIFWTNVFGGEFLAKDTAN